MSIKTTLFCVPAQAAYDDAGRGKAKLVFPDIQNSLSRGFGGPRAAIVGGLVALSLRVPFGSENDSGFAVNLKDTG
jgi:hypothetical protein